MTTHTPISRPVVCPGCGIVSLTTAIPAHDCSHCDSSFDVAGATITPQV